MLAFSSTLNRWNAVMMRTVQPGPSDTALESPKQMESRAFSVRRPSHGLRANRSAKSIALGSRLMLYGVCPPSMDQYLSVAGEPIHLFLAIHLDLRDENRILPPVLGFSWCKDYPLSNCTGLQGEMRCSRVFTRTLETQGSSV